MVGIAMNFFLWVFQRERYAKYFVRHIDPRYLLRLIYVQRCIRVYNSHVCILSLHHVLI
jgi:hypothetical protein